MAFEHKPGTFSLFKNTRKSADNHPDYTGNGMDLEGNKIDVAAWLKKSAKGSFMSCTLKPARANETSKGKGGGVEEDIPFNRLGKEYLV